MDKKTYGIKDIANLVGIAVHDVTFSRYKKEDIEQIEIIIKHLEGIDEAYQKFAVATGNTVKNIQPTDVNPYLPFKIHTLSRTNQKFAASAHRSEGGKILKDMEMTYLFFKHQHKILSQIVKVYNEQIEARNKANGYEAPDSPVQKVSAE